MKKIQLEKHDEWKKWQRDGIGSSDIPSIMNISPYKSKEILLLEKLSPYQEDASSNEFIFNKGHLYEEFMRDDFFNKKGVLIKPAYFCDKKFKYMHCSLDGITDNYELIWEHKMVGKDVFSKNEPELYHLVQVLYQASIVRKCKKIILQYTLYEKDKPVEESEYKYYEINPFSVNNKRIKRSIRCTVGKFWSKIGKIKCHLKLEN